MKHFQWIIYSWNFQQDCISLWCINLAIEISKFSHISPAGRKLVGGSNFGGLKETQEMLEFCGKHNITADIELIKMDQINTAMERLSKADVKYRFVIDVANSFSSL